jgi:hypothetical protein
MKYCRFVAQHWPNIKFQQRSILYLLWPLELQVNSFVMYSVINHKADKRKRERGAHEYEHIRSYRSGRRSFGVRGIGWWIAAPKATDRALIAIAEALGPRKRRLTPPRLSMSLYRRCGWPRCAASVTRPGWTMRLPRGPPARHRRDLIKGGEEFTVT